MHRQQFATPKLVTKLLTDKVLKYSAKKSPRLKLDDVLHNTLQLFPIINPTFSIATHLKVSRKMMKRVLCLYYSQTGQLESIVHSITAPLVGSDNIDIQLAKIRPKKDFPFPWPFTTFFNTFPESNYADPIELEPLDYSDEELAQFDLVILAYQVWFLSPSLPTSSFLQSKQAKILFKDTPVITVIGCRNMWLMAQESMKQSLENLGARLIDNVVLTDSSGAAFSFISTPLWMLTGNKGPVGIIPAAGVSQEKIQAASRFGKALKTALTDDNPLNTPLFKGLAAVEINENLIAS